ncbi:4'-phosphopantetheinyl transferase superfamily protein [Vibrio mediterranei]|nr:4'-phosphopantetheinyl transferase superfamily protein [Vibrio mediterranei]
MAQLCIETLSNTHCNVPIGSYREPLWPECLTGAISHTDNQAIALVAKQPSYQFVGLDIETNIENEVAQQICRDVYDADEYAIVSKQGLSLEVATTVIFSAKESLFKALFPYIGRFFGFECARVMELNKTNNSIVLKLDKGLSRYCSGKQIFRCRYFIHASKVITLILE